MKLTIKSLKQLVYPIEVESDQIEVLDLKKKIEESHQFDHKTVNLVFNGSKLLDNKKLCEYNIKDENVIIMMSSKVKPVNVNVNPPEESKKEEKVENKAESNTNTNSNSTSMNLNQNNQAQSHQTQPQAQPKPKKDYSNESKMLQDMGFAKSEADSAINAAKGNVSLAIEFLSNGHIPEDFLNDDEDEEMEGGDGSSGSSALRNIASLFKVLCQGDPTKFQGLLMNLQQTSPEIVELIQEHESEFKELIQAPITEEDIRNFQAFNQSAGGMMGQGGHMGHHSQSQSRGGDNVIRLTKEEFEAVNRLKELGFDEREAAQAFLACDKNEEYAANFLMENRIREQEEEMNIDCNLYIIIYKRNKFL
jgi:UV excision repair protein RAD23